MTRNEFIRKIEYGDDILFDVAGRHFVIFTWSIEDKGIFIGEQYVSESREYYKSAEELVDHFIVGEKSLADLAEDIIITDYTLVREWPEDE